MEVLRNRIYNFTFFLFFFLNGSSSNKIHTYRSFIIICFLSLVFIGGMYCQILYFYRNGGKFYILVNIAPTVSVMFLCILIMCIFYVKRKHNEMIFVFMRDDWALQKSYEEIRIKREYEDKAKTYITYNWLFGIFGVTFVVLQSFAPTILDVLKPLNGSRSRYQPFLVDCFLDPDEYYYVILIFETLASYLTIATVILGINMFIIVVYHACGMFTVIGHRLKNLEKLTDRDLTSFIEEHQRVIKFVGLLNVGGNEYLFLFLALTIGTLGVSLAEMMNVNLIAFRSVSFTLGHLMYFFMSNYLGQKMIDLSTNISIEAYNTKWYECRARQRRYIHFIILRSCKPCALTTINFYTFSFEDYAWVMKYAISYCMIISKVE